MSQAMVRVFMLSFCVVFLGKHITSTSHLSTLENICLHLNLAKLVKIVRYTSTEKMLLNEHTSHVGRTLVKLFFKKKIDLQILKVYKSILLNT